MGSLYRRGTICWVKYYENGRPRRESTGTEKETEARRFMKEREGRVATAQPILQRADRISYEEVAQDLRQHYQTTGSRNLKEAEYRLKHLDAFFAGRRVSSMGPTEVTAYVAMRQRAGASNSTINRDLAVLNKMLRLAYENNKLLRPPVIHRLKEGAPRQGFFEREQFEAVRRHLRPDLQVAVSIAYTFGWRMQSEVLTLGLRQLDLSAATLRLEPGTTKNDEARVVYLTPELKSLLTVQVERVRAIERQTGQIIPHLFPYLKGRHRGTRIRDFRKAWRTACVKGESHAMLRHDFRRTAVRNMVNLGVPERVAMKMTGHKTRSVFDRYHIVSPTDLREAARRLAGTIAGTMDQMGLDGHRVSM
jgi:integrase